MKTKHPYITAGCMFQPGLEVDYVDGSLQINGQTVDNVPVSILDSEHELMHHELNAEYWDNADGPAENAHLKPEVRERLLKIANEFYESTGFKAPIKDIILTGSACNYNYHAHSDLDTHIVIDYAAENEDVELVKNAATAMKSQWNDKHDIFIGSYECELYIQDASEPHTASGVYSLQDDKWLVVPSYKYITVDTVTINAKADDLRRQYQALQKRFDDGECTQELLDAVHDVRYKMLRLRKDAFEDGQDEFSVGNLAFKQLRNDGTIGAAIKLENALYDKLEGQL